MMATLLPRSARPVRAVMLLAATLGSGATTSGYFS